MRRALPVALLLCAICALPVRAAESHFLLQEGLRDGWAVRTSHELAATVASGVLRVQPYDRTRSFATVSLFAAGKDAVDGRACAYLTFEINTLPGAGGRHRAPLLRIGLSDASGRSRQPLLTRYLQLDADPTTWQQARIPLTHLLDRDVRPEAIALVSWQFAGRPAPFAVRRVTLVAGLETGETGADGRGNLLPDPSFENRGDARPVWALVGDYRDPRRPGERTLETGAAAHGARFLRLRGPRAYFFEAFAPRADAGGFAVALRAESPAAVEIGCEVAAFGAAGGAGVFGRATRIVQADRQWRRHAVSAAVDPVGMPAKEGCLRLYRAWVRPLAPNGDVDVDAAHLAATPIEAEHFAEGRANAMLSATGAYRHVRSLINYRPHTDAHDRPRPAGFQADLPPLLVPLEAREWAGRNSASAIVSGGVPLARGAVYSPDALRLRGADGREIPFQFEVLRRDPRDGSVRCLWLAFREALGAGRRQPYRLESGATQAHDAPPIAREVGDDVLINTGAFQLRLSRDSFPLYAEAQWSGHVVTGKEGGIRLELLDGRVLTSLGQPSRVTIERNGPLNAVIFVRGFLGADSPAPLPRFLYDVRLRAWQDDPGMQVDVAVTNLTPAPATPVRSLALVAPLPPGRRADATLGRENGPMFSAALEGGQFVRLTQLRDAFRDRREELLLERPGEPPALLPGRAAGWCRWQSAAHPPLLLALKHMADRHPAALEVRPDSMVAYLLPPSGSGVFDLPFGLTTYGEFWIGSGEDPAVLLDRLERPPLLAAGRAHTAASGVFGPFMLPEEARQRFPLLEGILRREMALRLDHHDRTGETGWLHDGSGGTFGWTYQGDADALEGLYLHYLRSGDPLAWDRARRALLHRREVVTWWSNETSAFQSPHASIPHWHYDLDIVQLRLTGILYDYWITGDRRSLEVADALGAELLARVGYAHYRGRERARMLLHLAELYAATGRRVYREGYARHLAHVAASEGDGGQRGSSVAALAGSLQWLDDADVHSRFEKELAALAARLLRQSPITSTDADEACTFRGLSAVAPEKLPRPVWEAALERIPWLFLAPHSRDSSLPCFARVLPAIAASGLALPEWASGTALGIGPYAGQTRTFTVRIHRRGSEPVRLILCRMRGSPPDPSRGYQIYVNLRDPLGRVVGHQILEGETLRAQSLDLPRVGMTGDYLLTLTCEEDGRVEVLSTHPRVYVRADEWRASRLPQGQGRFFLRAPRRGDIRVALRGSALSQADSLVAASLRALDGTLLGRVCWSVPLAGTDAEGRPPARAFPSEPLRLPVPPAYRSQTLVLDVTSAKWVEWCVLGLDEPWLAATAESFQP